MLDCRRKQLYSLLCVGLCFLAFYNGYIYSNAGLCMPRDYYHPHVRQYVTGEQVTYPEREGMSVQNELTKQVHPYVTAAIENRSFERVIKTTRDRTEFNRTIKVSIIFLFQMQLSHTCS